MPQPLDAQKTQTFARQLFTLYTGGMLTLMVQIGHKTGLFEAAAKGPATSENLARRAGLTERYVREWLGAMVTGRLMTYEPGTAEYALPPEHAACLTGGTRLNLAGYSGIVPLLAKQTSKIVDAFRRGGGVPYADFQPEFTEMIDEATWRLYDDTLISGFLPDLLR